TRLGSAQAAGRKRVAISAGDGDPVGLVAGRVPVAARHEELTATVVLIAGPAAVVRFQLVPGRRGLDEDAVEAVGARGVLFDLHGIGHAISVAVVNEDAMAAVALAPVADTVPLDDVRVGSRAACSVDAVSSLPVDLILLQLVSGATDPNAVAAVVVPAVTGPVLLQKIVVADRLDSAPPARDQLVADEQIPGALEQRARHAA